MEVLSVKLPETLFLEICLEEVKRKVTRPEVIRDRLSARKPAKTLLWDRMEAPSFTRTICPSIFLQTKRS